jgi:hypothetical protein
MTMAQLLARERSKVFFFEKKKQKTFTLWRGVPAGAYARVQKFFGSFFQKRTASYSLLTDAR